MPTKSGAIRIKNCLPEKNSTIADMLISFRRNETNGKNESLIPGENITHLIFSSYDGSSSNQGERVSFK